MSLHKVIASGERISGDINHIFGYSEPYNESWETFLFGDPIEYWETWPVDSGEIQIITSLCVYAQTTVPTYIYIYKFADWVMLPIVSKASPALWDSINYSGKLILEPYSNMGIAVAGGLANDVITFSAIGYKMKKE